jgi:hypothetical protein
MSASPEEVAQQFETAKRLVEEVIVKLGLEPGKLRGEHTPGLATWTIQRGSAAILLSVAKSDRGDEAFLRAISPVMTLPPEGKLPALFRRLLELNGHGLANAAFGIVSDRIVVKSERPTAFLTRPKSSRSFAPLRGGRHVRRSSGQRVRRRACFRREGHLTGASARWVLFEEKVTERP